ncbi:MAG: hypothetical protein ACTHNW_00020 [Mucilaginibacter sp.]
MNELLQKRWFWICFIIAVIIVLYRYGLAINGDRSKLKQLITELDSARKALQDDDSRIVALSANVKTREYQIQTLGAQNHTLKDSIGVKAALIGQMEDTIQKLKNEPPKLVYRDRVSYQDRIVYRDPPESYHPYGKNYGRLTIFKTCNCYNLKVWIDGAYAGSVQEIYKYGQPSCAQSGTVSQILLAGKHHIQGKDQEGHTWSFYCTLNEDQCLIRGVSVQK